MRAMQQKIRIYWVMSRISALEAIRYPPCLMLTASGALLILLLPILITHQFGEASRLVRDSALSLHWLLGIALAVFLASSVSRRNAEKGGAVLMLSKPVSREMYFLSVFTGLLLIELIFSVCMMLATSLAVAAAREPLMVDGRMLAPPLAALLVSLTAGAACNYWKQWNFCSVSVQFLLITLAAAWLCAMYFSPPMPRDALLGCAQAGLLNTLALGLFLALTTGLSLALGFPAAIALGGIFLCLGLLSDYFAQTAFGGTPAGRMLLACWPNWQRFWVSDLLKKGGALSWRPIGLAAAYAGSYALFILLLCMRKFRQVELS
ncbi:MAG: hypothetical protein PHP44_11185 [Kiritimatiellae bacterium]|nr:hypothetical protein [Kiritimatiellia bacterium]